MKKVLVLYTGGTIGMSYTENGLTIVKGVFKSQLDTLPQVSGVTLDLIEYENLIDSSDISVEHWVKIIDDISFSYDKYDGFVVIHGTDTMAYTASVLSFALRGLNKPVILTGSQLPLIHRRSDGWRNLIDAIYSATQNDLYEVAVLFNNKLFRGSRVQKISTDNFLGFDSVDHAPLAEFGINIAWYKKNWLEKPYWETFMPVCLKPQVKILDLAVRPGFTTDFIADTLNSTNAQAIILQTYGSGTIPMSNKKFVDAIINACNREIVVVSITQVIEGRVSSNYSNGQLDKLGVISGCDMTVEAAIAKLMVLFSTKMSIPEIKRAIPISLVGELTEINDCAKE